MDMGLSSFQKQDWCYIGYGRMKKRINYKFYAEATRFMRISFTDKKNCEHSNFVFVLFFKKKNTVQKILIVLFGCVIWDIKLKIYSTQLGIYI